TLAGSWFYAKSQVLLNELVRTGRHNAKIVLYDFELVFDDLFTKLHLKIAEPSPYDHQLDFSGLLEDGVVKMERYEEELEVVMSANELAHCILSVKDFYLYLINDNNEKEIMATLVRRLNDMTDDGRFTIFSKIYATVYKINKR
ncbi:MAG: hypothetical protein WBM83_08530, partial [Flavobacteriaceae bacterium]